VDFILSDDAETCRMALIALTSQMAGLEEACNFIQRLHVMHNLQQVFITFYKKVKGQMPKLLELLEVLADHRDHRIIEAFLAHKELIDFVILNADSSRGARTFLKAQRIIVRCMQAADTTADRNAVSRVMRAFRWDSVSPAACRRAALGCVGCVGMVVWSVSLALLQLQQYSRVASCSPLKLPCKYEFRSQTFSIKSTDSNTDVPPQTFRRCVVFKAGDSSAQALGFAHSTPYYIVNGTMSKKDGINAYDFQASAARVCSARACSRTPCSLQPSQALPPSSPPPAPPTSASCPPSSTWPTPSPTSPSTAPACTSSWTCCGKRTSSRPTSCSSTTTATL